MDPATRKDAWTLVVATMRETNEGKRRTIVLAKEWRPTRTQPLSPKAVLQEIATVLRPYRVSMVYTDQASGDALRDIGDGVDLTLVIQPTTASSRIEMYENLKARLGNSEIELPPDPQLKADLLGVRRRITRAGLTIDLPRTGGRHCDYAPAIALVMSKPLADPEHRARPGSAEWTEAGKERRRRAHVERMETPWWKRHGTSDRGENAGWRRR